MDESTQLHQVARRARPCGAAVVLSIGKLSLGQEAYYLSEVLDGAEDYYLNVGEAPGRWLGSAAGAIGLKGVVNADDLRAILAGADPTSGTPLRATKAELPGLDLTLSAPKSISIVWGLGDPAIAETVVDCHERAVNATITYLERYACHVRRGHGGAEVIEGGGFVAAGFRHRTSRLADPALHTHVLVANLAQGDDGRWTALDSRHLYRHARTAGFVRGRHRITSKEAAALLGIPLAHVSPSLARWRKKGLLFSPTKGGYVPIPPEYRSWRAVPASHFIDPLMRHLGHDYYMCLLTAAEAHGFAHQEASALPGDDPGSTARPFLRSRAALVRHLGRHRLSAHDHQEHADGHDAPVHPGGNRARPRLETTQERRLVQRRHDPRRDGP